MSFSIRPHDPAPTTIGGRRFVWGERTYVMGIINVTPDSFSGDGVVDPAAALDLAHRFVEAGADMLDVGGESTRPGHVAVSESDELRRVVPVIERLKSEIGAPISIDTYKPEVARAALRAGAAMVNDVWGLRRGVEKAVLAAETGAAMVLMHNQTGTDYAGDVVEAVVDGLSWSVRQAADADVAREKLIVDPGIGFGKTWRNNLDVLRRLDELQRLELPLLVGTSRKSTIGIVLDLPVEERLEGTAATVALAIAGGADIVRVHDVKEMVRVAKMSDAIVRRPR